MVVDFKWQFNFELKHKQELTVKDQSTYSLHLPLLLDRSKTRNILAQCVTLFSKQEKQFYGTKSQGVMKGAHVLELEKYNYRYCFYNYIAVEVFVLSNVEGGQSQFKEIGIRIN